MALHLVLTIVDAVLALFAVLIGVGALGSRWQRPEAARVVAAAKRGALDLLTQAAPFGALFLVLFLAFGSVAASVFRDAATSAESVVPGLLTVGLFGALLAVGGAWIFGWQVAQTTARMSFGASAPTVAIEMGRLTTATLVFGGAAGGCLASFCFAWFPAAPIQGALTGATAAVGLLSILSRPGVLSWAAAARSRNAEGLHPGSLAEFVGTAFASSWLLFASVLVLSCLGQVALFVLAKEMPHGLGTYALLLPRLGLFALACGGLGTRNSSRDGGQAVWQRELVVALAVHAGGAWALRGVLVGDAARGWAPALVCYLSVSFGLGAWLLGTRPKAEPSFTTPLALLPVLLLALLSPPPELGGTTTVLLLVIASLVALLPLAAAFRVGASAAVSAATCELLASGTGEPSWTEPGARPAPSPGQQALFLPLGLVLALCAVASVTRPFDHVGKSPLVLGLGALTTALLLLALSRRLESLGDEGGARLSALLGKRPDDGGLLLGEGLAVLKRVGGEHQLGFALTLLAPPLILLALAWTNSAHAFDLAAGSAVGALLWAALAERSPSAERSAAAMSALVWPLALYHLSWSALLLAVLP